ncbi:MAG TPA: dihydrofolate reductase [Devosiaceae bacterium]|nr:dihydrofolate reductase [Devosiaceae bacterium]
MLLPPAVRFTGHAIVSADGMIADADGRMPPELRSEADWQRFQAALDQSLLVVLGRVGHRRHPNPGRRRLVLTRSVERLFAPAGEPLVTLWNPGGTDIGAVLIELQVTEGNIAVAGGTGTFEHFLPYYDAFVLAEAHRSVLPGGRPCFGSGHPRTVLAAAGLVPGQTEIIDRVNCVTETIWRPRGR